VKSVHPEGNENMTDSTTPPIFLWIRENWEWLSVATASLIAMGISWIRHFVLTPINTLEKKQALIIRVIPVDAIEEGRLLRTQETCESLRTGCHNHVMSGELMATMTIMKQAMALVINHNSEIPKDQKDKILQELVR
jgi:hypothetical protein